MRCRVASPRPCASRAAANAAPASAAAVVGGDDDDEVGGWMEEWVDVWIEDNDADVRWSDAEKHSGET